MAPCQALAKEDVKCSQALRHNSPPCGKPHSPLEVLVLRDTAITDESLSSLKRLPCLRRLDLRHTFVTDVGLKSLRDSQNLKLLLVTETQVSKQAVQELTQHLPGLKSDLTE